MTFGTSPIIFARDTMTCVLLTGATGRLGQALRPRIADAGYDLRLASRSPPAVDQWTELDLAAGTGVRDAIEGVDIVVHTASAPQGDTEAVDVRGTERLLDAASEAGVENFVYVSIVGVDEISYGYYDHKLAAEIAVEESPVPSTILRATQFHQFVHDILDGLARLPVLFVPRNWQIQPIAAGEVADNILAHLDDPAGRLPDVGGPEVHTAGELAATYREARGLRRPTVGLPVPGAAARGFRDGRATCPDCTTGTVTWAAYLDRTVESRQPSPTIEVQGSYE